MKNLKDFITEKQNFLVKNKSILTDYDHYDYHPKIKDELKEIIIELLKQGETNLNCIDVSKITDMRYVFYDVNNIVKVKDVDISEWDVSNVNTMFSMFNGCEEFNSDLSNWDVSNVNDMSFMFFWCNEFNSDLSKWDVSKVSDMKCMFNKCEKFNSDLSNWNVSNVKKMYDMFYGCDTLKKNNKIPTWYKGEV